MAGFCSVADETVMPGRNSPGAACERKWNGCGGSTRHPRGPAAQVGEGGVTVGVDPQASRARPRKTASSPSMPGMTNTITRRRRTELVTGAIVLVILAVLPLPIRDVYTQNLIILTILYAGLSQAWNILGGYCGQISLGHALYFGAGAYVSTLLFVNAGIPPTIGMFAAGAGGGRGGPAGRLAVLPPVRPLLRHRHRRRGGDRLPAVPELGFRRRRHRRLRAVPRRELGRAAVPHLQAAVPLRRARLRRRHLGRRLGDRGIALGLFLARRAGRRGGRALARRAHFPSKMAAAAISGFFTAMGGAIYAQYVGYIDPDSVLAASFSILIALPAVLGGVGTLWGPLIGAIVLIPTSELTRSYLGGAGGVDLMIYGGLIVAISLARPAGLVSLLAPRRTVPDAPAA